MTLPTPVADSLTAQIDQAALAFARKWDLIDDQGQLWCVKRCGRAGRLPSLCCTVCLAAFRGGQSGGQRVGQSGGQR